MNLADITTKCYILALIIRDDGERLLLGDGAYEFKDSQQHFIANTYANDVVELQGTDGQMLAGQVRRTATQTFAGYIGDATFSKQKIEEARRDFLMFFRKKHYYTAVYVFSDGTAIQRDRGYIVNAPSVPELYQRFPEWSVGLNFEDPNYYEYAEDDLGHEIAAHKVELELSTAMSGGLIWDGDGAVSDDLSYVGTEIPGEGKNFQLADTGTATLKSAELLGDATQTTYSGKNLLNINATPTLVNTTVSVNGQTITVTTNNSSNVGMAQLPFTYEANRPVTVSFDAKMVQNDAGSGLISQICLRTPNSSDTIGNVRISDTVGQTNHYRATVTPDNNTRWLWLYTKATGVSGVVKVEYSNIQIEYNSSETSYEPYVGGTSAPNPEFPMPVNTVTGEQTVKIAQQGRNIADPQIFVDWVNNMKGLCQIYGWGNDSTQPQITTYDGKTNVASVDASTLYTKRNDMVDPTYDESLVIYKGIFEANTAYTISFKFQKNNTSGATNLQFRYTDGTNGSLMLSGLDSGWTSASFTSSELKTLESIKWTYSSGRTYIDLDTLQIEKGTTATSYEPFVSQTLPVNLGKNLVYTGDRTNQGITFAYNATTGETSVSGTASTTYANALQISEYLPAGTYTVSIQNTLPFTVGIGTRNSANTRTPHGIIAGNKSLTFTLSEPAFAYDIYLSALTGGLQINTTFKLQVERGSTATSFAPYFTPIELAKIGDYQDYIFNDNGTWKIHKAVGKVVLNGTENWTTSMVSGGQIRYFVINASNAVLVPANQISPLMSNYYTSEKRDDLYNLRLDYGATLHSTRSELDIRNKDITTVADWQTWLASNPTTVYYALATPIETEITNSELVGQLERIRHSHTYADATNFSITATSPNLPAFLKVVAFGDDAIPQGGYVWEDGGTGGATTITVDGVDNAQPIWTVVGPATNPSLTNITTGESIQWTGVVPNGQTLVVNMADMTASLSGANVFEFISGSWITLQAGNNRVSYSATAATGIATLEWNGVVG